MTRSPTPSRGRTIWMSGMLLCAFCATIVSGQENGIRFERRQVEAAQLPELIRSGRLVPISREDFNQRLKDAERESGPRDEVTADRVQYDSAFANGKLTGTFEATFPRISAESWAFFGSVPFDTFAIAETSEWGCDGSGNTLARVPNSRQLNGTWTLNGSTHPWGTELNFQPLAALSNELKLTLPQTLSVESDNAIVQPGSLNGTERQYRIVLNDRSPSRLRIVNALPNPQRPIGDIRTNWTVTQDTAEVQTDFNLQATSPVTALSIIVPPNITVQSVTYGDNQAIPIAVTETPQGRRLQVTMPRAIRGASRRLALSGRLEVGIRDEWQIPSFDNITCSHSDGSNSKAIARRVSHRVRIESPLELQALKLDGFRQTDSVFQTGAFQTVSLTRLFESGKATLRVGQARRARQFQIATRVDFETDVWKQRTWMRADTPLPDELDLRTPVGFRILAINTGGERTPCDFRIDANDNRLIHVFMPPTVSSTLEIISQSNTSPSRAITPVEGNVLAHTLIAPKQLVDKPTEALTNVQPGLVRTAFGPTLDTTFIRPDDLVVQTADDRLLKLKQPETQRDMETPDSPEAKEDAAPISSLSLTSLIRRRPHTDTHTAIFDTTSRRTLTFSLPTSAHVVNISVNGTMCRFQRDGESVTVALDSSDVRNVVTVCYQSSAQPNIFGLTATRQVPIPKFPNTGDFTWEIQTAPTLNLSGTSLFDSEDQNDRFHNLLGPFASLPVKTSLGPTQLPFVPDELTVTTTSTSASRHGAWISLMAAMLFGLLMGSYRQTAWLCVTASVLVVLALSLSGETGIISGGAFIGTLSAVAVANLLPKPKRASSDQTSQGSRSLAPTVTAGLALLLTTSTINVVAFAQTARRDLVVFEIGDRDTLYADKALLDLLDVQRRSNSTNLLTRDARYVVRFDNGGLSIRATIEAIVRDASKPATATFPFADANVSRCRIDDKPMDFVRDGDDIKIAITPTNEDGNADVAPITIEFDLHPPSNGNRCTIKTAIAARSVCRIESGEDIRMRLNGTEAALNTDLTVIDGINVAPIANTNESLPQVASFETTCSVEVAPVETSIEYQVTATPGLEAIREVSFELPPKQRFVSLTCPVASRQSVVLGKSAAHVRIVFDEPVLAPIDLRLKASLTSDSAVPGQSIRLQPIVTGPTTVSVSPRANLRLTALSWQPDRESKPSNLGPTDGQPLQYEIDSRGTMQFELETAKAIRELRLDQQIQIKPDRLNYTLDAEVQVVNGPVFAHRLNVSRELQIESVSVRENGVDRMARYQRLGNQLLLLLEGRTSGTQNIVIEGQVLMALGELVAVPGVIVQDARFRQSTLTLSRDADLSVELLDTNGIPFAVRPDTALFGSLESGEATFELLESSQLPSIRAKQASPMTVIAVCLMDIKDGKPVGWTWQYRLENTGKDQIAFDAKGGELRSTSLRSEDGQTTLYLDPDRDETVTFSITFDKPSDVIPEPTFDPTISMQRQLAIPMSPEFAVTDSNPAEPNAPKLIVDRTTDTLRFYELPKDSSGIRVTQKQLAKEAAVVNHMETTLWDLGDTVAGKTVIPLPETPSELRVHVPAEIRVISSGIDGRAVPPKIESEQLIIPPQSGKQVTVRWTTSVSDTRQFNIPSPDLVNGEALFAFVPRTDDIELQSGDLIPITNEQFNTARKSTTSTPEANAILMLSRVTTAKKVGQQLQLTTINTRSPMIGIALVAGVVTLLTCLGASYIRTRNRILLLSGTLSTIALATAGSTLTAAMFLMPGLLGWWLIPRRM